MRKSLSSAPVALILSLLMLIILSSCSKESDQTPSSQKSKAQHKEKTELSEHTAQPTQKTIQVDDSTAISFKGMPEGFPVDLLPPYPKGEIDRSALSEGEGTLLQTSTDSLEIVLAYYTKLYQKKGFKREEPITFAGRTMRGFNKSGMSISMTLQTRDDGKTFFSLAN